MPRNTIHQKRLAMATSYGTSLTHSKLNSQRIPAGRSMHSQRELSKFASNIEADQSSDYYPSKSRRTYRREESDMSSSRERSTSYADGVHEHKRG